ncbi:DUF664 domain-containing protein [Micromonospora sp. KC207]|uniref:mycothiol transferase n=1 Tax=Micromonospora sp. KC207 TaxID=2530377 RepID=UPI001FB825D2|nr:DUF664 domain-containing protein [Micromonospora sp. KC207]
MACRPGRHATRRRIRQLRHDFGRRGAGRTLLGGRVLRELAQHCGHADILREQLVNE